MDKNKTKIVLSWTGVLLWLVLIFSLSSQSAPQSAGLSKKVTKFIVDMVDKVVKLDEGKEDVNLLDN